MFETLGAALIIVTNPNLQGCWEVQPGPSIVDDAAMDGWYLDGEHLLDTPKTWTVIRTYEELESYGFCEAGTSVLKIAEEFLGQILPSDPEKAMPLKITDDALKRAIGNAEGTRDENGNPTQAYYGHEDPVQNGSCKNLGSFSYQHCASSPEEADSKWLAVLKERALPRIQNQAAAKFNAPLSDAALIVALDGYTQSPDAGLRFVGFLPTHDPTPEQLIEARINALDTSRSTMGGWAMAVSADQQRRVLAVLGQLEKMTEEMP